MVHRLPRYTAAVPGAAGPPSLADVSEEQRLLEKFGLTDLTAKAIKTAQDFLDVQQKVKCIAGYKSGEHRQALFQRNVPGGPCHR